MRAQLRVAWFVLFGATRPPASPRPARADRQGAPPAPDVRAILRAASQDLALKQGEEERFWTDQALLKIGELQGRAGDFTGALRTLRRVNDVFRRKSGLSDLIQPLARAGRRGEAVEVSRLLGTELVNPGPFARRRASPVDRALDRNRRPPPGRRSGRTGQDAGEAA